MHGAGEHPRLQQDLETVADADHQPTVVGETLYRIHDGRKMGDSAATQIIAVGKTSGKDDAIEPLDLSVLVPEIAGIGAGERADGVVRVGVAVGAGKDHDPEANGCDFSLWGGSH